MTELEPGLLHPGGHFGDFEVVAELGRGGMGAVYRVRDPETGLDYAAKVMLPGLGGEDMKRRFIREAELAMKVEHRNLVKVYDVGRDPETGYAYMIMDYAPGGCLHDRISERLIAGRRFTVREALEIVRKILSALSAAAAHGVVHRDIKPDNILFDEEGEPVLTDLGVAKDASGAVTVLTMSNVIVGTPAYMAPEQMTSAHDVDIRADLYALGIVLWEMLAGERPNADASQSELMVKAVRCERIPDIGAYRKGLPRHVTSFIKKMTDPRPQHRFATPDAALRFLEEWRELERRNFRRFLVCILSATALVLVAVVAVGVRWIADSRAGSALSEGTSKAADGEFSIPDSVE